MLVFTMYLTIFAGTGTSTMVKDFRSATECARVATIIGDYLKAQGLNGSVKSICVQNVAAFN